MTVSGELLPQVELRHLGGRGNSFALVCVPYAGGSTAMFRPWPKLLPSADLFALDLPGRGARLTEPPFTSLDPLVASALQAMRPLRDRPFALFGHSMGALIAYEAARILRRNKAALPIHLFVSGFRAPHLPDPKPPLFELPRARFVDELQRIDAPSFDLAQHSELIDLMLPTLRADFQVVQTYRYRAEAALTCPITAFGGAEDKDVSERELQEWRQHTSADFTSKMFPGGHFFLEMQSRALLSEIEQRLADQVR